MPRSSEVDAPARPAPSVTAQHDTIEASHDGVTARLTVSSGEVLLQRHGVEVATARWYNHRSFTSVVSSFASRFNPDTLLPRVTLDELALAIMRAERDPVIMARVGVHPAHLVLLGARPEHGVDPQMRGQIAQEIGDLHEHEGVALVRRALEGVPWLVRVRRGDADEDRRGLDLVVECRGGVEELYVQVKSSPRAMLEHRKKYEGAPEFPRTLILLVAGSTESREAATRKASAELRRLYREHGGTLVEAVKAPCAVAAAPFRVPPSASDTAAKSEYDAHHTERSRQRTETAYREHIASGAIDPEDRDMGRILARCHEVTAAHEEAKRLSLDAERDRVGAKALATLRERQKALKELLIALDTHRFKVEQEGRAARQRLHVDASAGFERHFIRITKERVDRDTFKAILHDAGAAARLEYEQTSKLPDGST